MIQLINNRYQNSVLYITISIISVTLIIGLDLIFSYVRNGQSYIAFGDILFLLILCQRQLPIKYLFFIAIVGFGISDVISGSYYYIFSTIVIRILYILIFYLIKSKWMNNFIFNKDVRLLFYIIITQIIMITFYLLTDTTLVLIKEIPQSLLISNLILNIIQGLVVSIITSIMIILYKYLYK